MISMQDSAYATLLVGCQELISRLPGQLQEQAADDLRKRLYPEAWLTFQIYSMQYDIYNFI